MIGHRVPCICTVFFSLVTCFPQIDDSDSEGECALSENWMFQRESRRWSRVDDIVNSVVMQPSPNQNQNQNQPHPQPAGGGGTCNLPQPTVVMVAAADGSDAMASRFRRSGSERLRDGAKAILRRVESLKTRRRKQRNRDGIVIGSPQVRTAICLQFFFSRSYALISITHF